VVVILSWTEKPFLNISIVVYGYKSEFSIGD